MENLAYLIEHLKGKEIKLDKPIVFFDLETTGTDVINDRIIEFSAIKFNVDYSTEEYSKRFNPQIPISSGATAVNGITDDDVVDCPTFGDCVDEIKTFMKDCDLGGYNIMSFDIPILIEEFKRNGSSFKYGNRMMVDAYKVLVKAEPRDLASVYKNITGDEIETAHNSSTDTMAAATVAFNQLDKYDFNSLSEMAKFANEGLVDASGFFKRDTNGTIVFALGKYKGKGVLDVYQNAGDEYYFEKYIKAKCNSDINNHLNLIIKGIEK